MIKINAKTAKLATTIEKSADGKHPSLRVFAKAKRNKTPRSASTGDTYPNPVAKENGKKDVAIAAK